MIDIVMPRLSDSMTEGTVVRWLKQPGDTVQRGEPLAEIETDKATITYESDVEGVISQLLLGEGESAPVGTQIALLQPLGAQQTPPTAPQPTAPPQPLASPAGPPPADPPPLTTPSPGGPPPLMAPSPRAELLPQEPDAQYDAPAPPPGAEPYEAEPDDFEDSGERVKASPIAKRLAAKLGVDLTRVVGSGPGGRVVKEDVESAAAATVRADSAEFEPTQALAPPEPQLSHAGETAQTDEFAAGPEYAYEPGDVEVHEDDRFSEAAPLADAPPLPDEPQAIPAPLPIDPSPVGGQAAPIPQQSPQQDPPLIPNFPPPPAPAPQQAPYPQQPIAPQYGVPHHAPYGQPQPFPSPPPFVQGMTGGFPAISPQPAVPQPPMPQPPMPAAGMPPTQQFQQPTQPFQQAQPQQAQPQQAPIPQQLPTQQPPAQQGDATATRGLSTPIEPTSAQQTVARRMAESKATAPEFFVETEVDMTTCVAYREQLRSVVSPLPSFNDFVIKAAAQALRQYPNVNAAYKDGHFEQYSDVNIGVVVSATELLAVPTLFNVDQKGLTQIAAESQQLSDAVRTRTIQPSQLSGGTFSVSNLGMYGVDRFTAILNPPQAAILAVGAINRRAVIAEDGMSLVIRQIMNMTLTCDHRILYGAEAAEFLGAIKAWLESPQLLQV